MTSDHEQLDVDRVALEFVAESLELGKRLSATNRHTREQLRKRCTASIMSTSTAPLSTSANGNPAPRLRRYLRRHVIDRSLLKYPASPFTPEPPM